MRPAYDPARRNALSALVAGRRGVTSKLTFGCPAFYTRGKLFAGVVAGGVLLKLPPGDAADLLAANRAVRFAPFGRPLGGWVVVPGVDAEQVAEAERYVRAGGGIARRR